VESDAELNVGSEELWPWLQHTGDVTGVQIRNPTDFQTHLDSDSASFWKAHI